VEASERSWSDHQALTEYLSKTSDFNLIGLKELKVFSGLILKRKLFNEQFSSDNGKKGFNLLLASEIVSFKNPPKRCVGRFLIPSG
jgi:hypothetical protein